MYFQPITDGQPVAASSNERGANPNEGAEAESDPDMPVDGMLLDKDLGIAGSTFEVEDPDQLEEQEGWSAWTGFQYFFIPDKTFLPNLERPRLGVV